MCHNHIHMSNPWFVSRGFPFQIHPIFIVYVAVYFPLYGIPDLSLSEAKQLVVITVLDCPERKRKKKEIKCREINISLN